MELRQLRYFVAIAEERHFGRAARRLRISTPTLSQQLRVLERGLGVVLVERSRPGPVNLTRAGDVLLRHARVLVSTADRARDEVRAADRSPDQVLLRVAFGAEHLVAAQLRRLDEDDAFDVVTLASSTSDALLALRETSWDAAVVWDGLGARQGLTTTVLREVDVHLGVPATHRLAGSSQVAVDELAEETVVMFPRALSPHVWDVMHGHLLPHGPSRADQVVIRANTLGPVALLHAVAAGKGVAPVLVPLAGHAPHPGTVVLPLVPTLRISLELAWREPVGRAVGRVLAVLRSGADGSSAAGG